MKAAEPNHCAIFSGVGSICAEVLLSLMPTALEPGEGLLRCREMPNRRRGCRVSRNHRPAKQRQHGSLAPSPSPNDRGEWLRALLLKAFYCKRIAGRDRSNAPIKSNENLRADDRRRESENGGKGPSYLLSLQGGRLCRPSLPGAKDHHLNCDGRQIYDQSSRQYGFTVPGRYSLMILCASSRARFFCCGVGSRESFPSMTLG
jgi:hypothetical protein